MTTIEPLAPPQASGAATHVFIIGVGSYRHLFRGVGPRMQNDFGMTQLSSPPFSARAFADWVMRDYNNPNAPLGSVELLISEANPASYMDPHGREWPPEAATIAAILTACDGWTERCHAHKDNVAIFFFCGHGLQVGGAQILLAEDFGESNNRPFENAINFEQFYRGMRQFKAGLKCFFIDACNNQPQATLKTQLTDAKSLVTPTFDHAFASSSAPILKAAATGSRAFGEVEGISRFTDALLRCLNGLGAVATLEDDSWRVTTGELGKNVPKTVEWLFQEAKRRDPDLDIDPQDARSDGESKDLPLHVLKSPPLVPVRLSVEPSEALALARLSLTAVEGGEPLAREPAGEEWAIDLPADKYWVEGTYDRGGFRMRNARVKVPVFPPGVRRILDAEVIP